jgi:hypothetical protein
MDISSHEFRRRLVIALPILIALRLELFRRWLRNGDVEISEILQRRDD